MFGGMIHAGRGEECSCSWFREGGPRSRAGRFRAGLCAARREGLASLWGPFSPLGDNMHYLTACALHARYAHRIATFIKLHGLLFPRADEHPLSGMVAVFDINKRNGTSRILRRLHRVYRLLVHSISLTCLGVLHIKAPYSRMHPTIIKRIPLYRIQLFCLQVGGCIL